MFVDCQNYAGSWGSLFVNCQIYAGSWGSLFVNCQNYADLWGQCLWIVKIMLVHRDVISWVLLTTLLHYNARQLIIICG